MVLGGKKGITGTAGDVIRLQRQTVTAAANVSTTSAKALHVAAGTSSAILTNLAAAGTVTTVAAGITTTVNPQTGTVVTPITIKARPCSC